MILTYVSIENSNYVLIEFIDFKKYERKIDQNSSRSIIRVKRIYRIFYYRKNLCVKLDDQSEIVKNLIINAHFNDIKC